MVPPEVSEPALELLLDLVLAPSIPKSEFSLERSVVLEEIAQYRDQPDEQIFQTLLETCWMNHSYGRSILGHEESLQTSTPDLMKSFHNRLYQAQNCCLSIAGKIPKSIENSINSSLICDLGELPRTKNYEVNNENLLFQSGRKEIYVPSWI